MPGCITLATRSYEQVIGEQKGEGIKVACKCFWDQNTDAFAKETFENKSVFAVATVYGAYYY